MLNNSALKLSVSPLAVTFGTVNLGSKAVQTVLLTSNDTTAIAVSGITVGGADKADFTQTNTCGVSLKAGWTCTVTVTFQPGAEGTRSGTLLISDSEGSQTVMLNGEGK